MASNAVVMRWTGQGEAFVGGRPGGVEIPIDGKAGSGPSPVDTLLLSIAGCMGIDVILILEKSRVPVEAMEMEISAERAESPPRRLKAVKLDYRITGPDEEHRSKIDRAVGLSKDKYCSVIHSLRPDLDWEIGVELA